MMSQYEKEKLLEQRRTEMVRRAELERTIRAVERPLKQGASRIATVAQLVQRLASAAWSL